MWLKHVEQDNHKCFCQIFFVLALSEELWEEHPEQGLPGAHQAIARRPSWVEAMP